jgi:hypothetical protein
VQPDDGGASTSRAAGVAGVRVSGSVPVGDAVLRDDALRGKEACRGESASRAKDVAGEAGRKGGLAADEVTGCLGGDGGEGGELQPSSCGVCLLLASTAARLLTRVASLYVFAFFLAVGLAVVTAMPVATMPVAAMPVAAMPTMPAEM